MIPEEYLLDQTQHTYKVSLKTALAKESNLPAEEK